MLVLSVFFALVGAASNATGTVLQRKAALAVPPEDALRPRLMADLLRQSVFLLGVLGVAGAALFQALALVTGPLALVQPVFVMELPFALLISLPVLHRTLPGSGWVAVGCMVVGLVLGLGAAAPGDGRGQASLTRWVPACALCVGAIAAAVLTLGDASVSLALGVAVYGEHIRTGWWLLPEIAGVALVAAGTLHLSRSVPLTRELAM